MDLHFLLHLIEVLNRYYAENSITPGHLSVRDRIVILNEAQRTYVDPNSR